MEYILIILALFVFARCEGNIWTDVRPLYVVERFPLTEPFKADMKFPLNTVGFKTAADEPLVKIKPMSTLTLTTKTPTQKPVIVTPSPTLVNAIPKEHKAKIKALHMSCHKTGCQQGSQCVYDRVWMCPTYIPDLECSCRSGCAVGNTFIPMGKTLTMDECGNRCSCQDSDGKAICTKRKCTEKMEVKDTKMDSILKYLKELVTIKLQDTEKDAAKTDVKPSVSSPLETSASDKLQQRITSSNDINLSPKIDFHIKTRFPYNPNRPMYLWT